MATETQSATGRAQRDDSPAWLVYPEYGPVEAALGYGLFYLLVATATPVMVEVLGPVLPGLVPTPFATVMALFCWFVLGVVVLAQVRRQVAANPRRFADAAERAAFLDAHRPTARDYGLAVAATAGGGLVAAFGVDAALAGLDSLLRSMVFVSGGAAGSVDLLGVGWLVVLFVSFGLFSRGVDRLVVGALRELLAR